jgi:transaldolase
MDIYLDTANLADIKKYADLGIVDGVTTNPSLIAKEGVSLEKRVKEICEVISGPVSSEVIATETSAMVKEGRKYVTWADNVYVKLPMTVDGIRACKILSDEGVNVNMTLIFSINQALLAAKAGAALVSPFVGRLDDIAENGMALVREMVTVYENYDFDAQVLAASIRHPEHVAQAAMMGADIVTIPPAILDQLFHHPLTDVGLKKFLADWKKVKGKQK